MNGAMRGTLISVLLPVRDGAETLPRAAACILGQTHRELELLVVLNGADGATSASAAKLAGEDRRVRMVSCRAGNLASALNLGLSEVKGDLVARMDADDECFPRRLELQAAAMERRRDLAALGAAWEVVSPVGRVVAVNRPPTDEREARWRLLAGNPFAHGSMMLRREAVLRVGGYDERLERAQDYDLWMRLRAAGVAALPDVLYRYRLRDGEGYSSSAAQATAAAEIMTRAWRELPRRDDPEAAAGLAEAMGEGGAEGATERIERAMTRRGPSRALLEAWLWCRGCGPRATRTAADVGRAARLREFARELSGLGVSSVWVYGAGAHTEFLLPALRDAGLRVEGVVDDTRTGERAHGFPVASPGDIAVGAHVVLSSDAHERALWRASEPLRARGVHVHRIYAASGEPVGAAS